MLDPDEPVNMLDIPLNDPYSFDCSLFDGSRLDGITVDSLPLSIIKDEPYAVDEGYLSSCCKFVTLWMSMPSMSGGVPELDVDFGLEFGPFDGDGPRMIVLLDPSLWRTLMSTDLNLETLRWFLLTHQFDFKVHDKG